MKIDYNKLKELNALRDIKDEELPPGGYIGRMLSVEDIPDKMCLKICYDVAEGDYKNFYAGIPTSGFYPGMFHVSYKSNALIFLAKFIKAVETSNPDYVFNSEKEYELVGKLVGLVLRKEEYPNKYKDIEVKNGVAKFTSADDIRKGNYPTFGIKRYEPKSFIVEDNQ